MATRIIFTPESAAFPTNEFAGLRKESISDRTMISFGNAAANIAIWSAVSPENFVANAAGNISLHLTYFMSTGTTGNVVLVANVEAPAYTTEAANANLFASGQVLTANVAATNSAFVRKIIMDVPADGLQTSSYFRIRIRREGAATFDTAPGDFNLLAVEMKDSL